MHEEGLGEQTVGWEEIEPVLRDRLAGQADDGRKRDSPSLYVVVEKILGYDETFPGDWRTHGTSGYEALNRINGLFVDPASAAEFTRRYPAGSATRRPIAMSSARRSC